MDADSDFHPNTSNRVAHYIFDTLLWSETQRGIAFSSHTNGDNYCNGAANLLFFQILLHILNLFVLFTLIFLFLSLIA